MEYTKGERFLDELGIIQCEPLTEVNWIKITNELDKLYDKLEKIHSLSAE